jgi:hypothetical protein
MLHKLRAAMGDRDELYKLSGVIELDEGFFSTEIFENEKDTPSKCGRGSQRKTKVLVMAKSEPVEGKTTKKGRPREVGRIKMMTINDLKSYTITSLVQDTPGYIQSYLNEFCYKFNRHYLEEALFDRLIITSVNYKNQFRHNYG